MKITSRLIMIALAFLIHSCVEQIDAENEDSDILSGLESTLPEGWHKSRIFHIDTAKIPTGLSAPEQVFRIYKEEQPQRTDTLSFLLFFYDVKQKSAIDSIIQEQAIYSWCTPIAFAVSTEYYAITSPCYIHSSSVAERGMEISSVINKVKEYIEKQ